VSPGARRPGCVAGVWYVDLDPWNSLTELPPWRQNMIHF
jgi:hypothetical protein